MSRPPEETLAIPVWLVDAIVRELEVVRANDFKGSSAGAICDHLYAICPPHLRDPRHS